MTKGEFLHQSGPYLWLILTTFAIDLKNTTYHLWFGKYSFQEGSAVALTIEVWIRLQGLKSGIAIASTHRSFIEGHTHGSGSLK